MGQVLTEKIGINLIYTSLKNRRVLLLSILVLSFLVWFVPFSFFWRDDWWYIQEYIDKNYLFITGDYHFDIKPLFKYFYFSEFFMFKREFALYQTVSIALFGLWVYASSIIFSEFVSDKRLRLLFTLVLLFNPGNFVNILVLFQQCELLHLMLVNVYLIFLIKYVNTTKSKFLILSLFFLIIQHLFFPNGFFFPFLGIGYLLLYGSKKWQKNISIVMLLAVTLMYYIYSTVFLHINNLIAQNSFNILLILKQFVACTSASLLRLFLVSVNTYPFAIELFVFIAFFAFILYHFFRADKERKKILAILSAWIVVSSIPVSVVRYNSTLIPYYYTSLNALPILILLLYMLAPYQYLFERKYSFNLPLLLTSAYFLLALAQLNYGKFINLRRNVSNQYLLEGAISNNTQYMGYDEPFTNEKLNLMLYNNASGGEAIKQVYNNFQKK